MTLATKHNVMFPLTVHKLVYSLYSFQWVQMTASRLWRKSAGLVRGSAATWRSATFTWRPDSDFRHVKVPYTLSYYYYYYY